MDEEEEEEERAFQEEIQQWRKAAVSGSGTTTKPKYVYKTLDEIKEKSMIPGKEKGRGAFGSETKVKVIDMTGREARVMDSYEEMRQTKAGKSSAAGMTLLIPLMILEVISLV